MAVSLAQLNLKAKSDQAYEFEVVDEDDGQGMGIFISVVGEHSKKVQDLITNTVNGQRRAEAIRKGKSAAKKEDYTPVEEDIDFSNQLAAARIVGWKGISEEYSPENALLLCSTNPSIKDQVTVESQKIKNFTKG